MRWCGPLDPLGESGSRHSSKGSKGPKDRQQSPPSQSHCWLLYSSSQILSPIQCSSPGDVLHVVGDAGVVVLDVEVVVLDVEVDIVLPVPPLPATARKVLSTSI